ncbi:MAG: hypothetical protein Q8S33_34505 [Myxococcales bacterium]|nr:hypothetical protein [Myxococcales bacterium]
MTKRSFSVAGLLLLAGVLGIGAGAVLGSRPGDEDETEAMFAQAESTAEKLIPMGEPMSGAARNGVDPMTADPRSLRGIPPYPGAKPRRLADVGQVMGMPLMASWFSTRDQPEQIIAHYEYTYADAGIAIVSHMFGRDMGYVAWLEEERVDGGFAEGIVHMVSVIKNTPTSTETIVLLSASRPQRLLDGKRNLPAGLVLPTEARPPQVVQLAMEGKTRSIITTARRGELVGTVDEIVTLMRKDGWAVEDLMSSGTSRSFIGRKAGLSQSVSATAQEGSGEVSLMYSLEQERRAP